MREKTKLLKILILLTSLIAAVVPEIIMYCLMTKSARMDSVQSLYLEYENRLAEAESDPDGRSEVLQNAAASLAEGVQEFKKNEALLYVPCPVSGFGACRSEA